MTFFSFITSQHPYMYTISVVAENVEMLRIVMLGSDPIDKLLANHASVFAARDPLLPW
jgi:hypothetical protein